MRSQGRPRSADSHSSERSCEADAIESIANCNSDPRLQEQVASISREIRQDFGDSRRKRRNWTLAQDSSEPRVSDQDARIFNLLAAHRIVKQSQENADVTLPQVDGPADEPEETSEPPPMVYVLPRPWKTPDGAVNRPVLDMMLRGVLFHIMTAPGVNLTNLVKKYGPILQPVPLLDVLEVRNALNRAS